MSISVEQLAELLAGIARSQQAIIDAIESESGGWRNTHLLPKLNTAANMRLANARLIDIPSRILLRSQGRVPMDNATIMRDLTAAMGAVTAVAATPTAAPKATPTAPVAPTASAAPAVNPAPTPSPAPAAAPATKVDDEELNFFDN